MALMLDGDLTVLDQWVGTLPWEVTSCASMVAPKTRVAQSEVKVRIIHRGTGVNWGFQGVFPRVEPVKTGELCLVHRHSQV